MPAARAAYNKFGLEVGCRKFSLLTLDKVHAKRTLRIPGRQCYISHSVSVTHTKRHVRSCKYFTEILHTLFGMSDNNPPVAFPHRVSIPVWEA